MVAFLLQIGPIGVPIFIASILGVTVFLERLYALRTDKIIPKQLCFLIDNAVQKGELDSIYALNSADEHMLGDMISLIHSQQEKGGTREQISARLEEWASQKSSEMERGLEALGVISSVAPMLGLMGTVLGMVVTFESIQTYGLGNADALAGGISQALLTTLIGLAVGVPTLMAHRFLLTVVDGRLLLLQQLATELLDLLSVLEKGES